MHKRNRLLGVILLATLTSASFAYNPNCHNHNLPWLNFIPIQGPIHTLEVRHGPPTQSSAAAIPQIMRTPAQAEAHFDQRGAITYQRDLDGTTATHEISNNLRQISHVTWPDGTKEQQTYTYRAFAPDGRPTEYAMDVTGTDDPTRYVVRLTYHPNNRQTLQETIYLPDGTIIGTTEFQAHHCLITNVTMDTEQSETNIHLTYWHNGEETPTPENATAFEKYRVLQRSQPKPANNPLFITEAVTFEITIHERDQHNNPTLFTTALLEQQFDELTPTGTTLWVATYTYH